MTTYLGIDAGGTFTRFVLFNQDGEAIKRIETSSVHYMKVGFSGIATTFAHVKSEFLAAGHDLDDAKIAIGMAGYGSDAAIRASIEEAVYSVFAHALIVSDAALAMASALDNQDGVYVISGTGSIALRKLGCEQQRSGGFGYLLGDEGSAFWIGKRLLQRFTQEADGRAPKTSWYHGVMDHFNLTDPYQIIALANGQKDQYREWVASFSKLAARIDGNDAIATVFSEAGQELAALANGFELNGKTMIAGGGSVLLNNHIVMDSFAKHLKADYELIAFDRPVEYAAYLLLKDSN